MGVSALGPLQLSQTRLGLGPFGLLSSSSSSHPLLQLQLASSVHPFSMVKLSLFEKDKTPAEGTSFTPHFTTSSRRPKTAPAASSSSSVLPSLLRLGSDAPATLDLPPILTLKLSSPSFLDSVVHDGLSDNPLYVMETQDSTTKIRRSDPKGFINVARIRWRQDAKSSRRSKELVGIHVAFGKGQWKPAEEFLGYPYGSLLSYRKFYLPHHPHSMRWKRVGSNYYCSTANVKGPVAILEPANLTAPPQLKVFDALHRPDASQPQRTHGGVPLSLLDFLLVTSMLLTTDADEWTNVTRAAPSTSLDLYPDGHAGPSQPSRYSQGSSLSLSSAARSFGRTFCPGIARLSYGFSNNRALATDCPSAAHTFTRQRAPWEPRKSSADFARKPVLGIDGPNIHTRVSGCRPSISLPPLAHLVLLSASPIFVRTAWRRHTHLSRTAGSPSPNGRTITIGTTALAAAHRCEHAELDVHPGAFATTRKAPPNYLASAHDSAVEGVVAGVHGLAVQRVEEITRDPPPAYSAIDTHTTRATATAIATRPPLRAVNGDPESL
ncbi:hypothetical protein EW146_g8753 [Bondarzewia mesenterica]|uniref:Uncharacterized protein n=1 Tax=Bondarzewia mesenterica TaxID=1095465 RepID=A0A4S4LDK0_9AGAM|nr:hypothetical protein EW146_g8753 [Bondarzewia mesenterica]